MKKRVLLSGVIQSTGVSVINTLVLGEQTTQNTEVFFHYGLPNTTNKEVRNVEENKQDRRTDGESRS